jgi:signal transduction histidine kinase
MSKLAAPLAPITDSTTRRPFRRRKQLERDLEHITEQIYKKNYELAETNKTLSLLRGIDGIVLAPHQSLQTVCDKIAQAVTEAADYPFVGICTSSLHATDELLLHGWSVKATVSKKPPELSKPLRLKLSQPWLASLEQNTLVSLEDISLAQAADHTNYTTAEIRHLKQQLPLKSLYVVKLQARRRLVGLIIVGFMSPAAVITENDTLLMERLSESVGVALDSKLLFEENQYVLKQLRESNSKLRALDEAKDDFISMASHQLRTPLTSVKGYISMLMEGDGGKVTSVQQNMLSQAFFSSQRMVYLIADLLNISRLKTGKFIVEPTQINLANMVQQELEQLQEAANARKLTLTYDRPKEFPDLMLDETKTRQVIMNFVDNAIYYTPAGGHITVRLVDKPTVIELRVEDDGIGVPKTEQPHLFTKFYRAPNARKARPDGTGLGLYMAKKVIAAEGGSLVFESEVGKGSTFGFVFSKHKLAVAPKS